MTEGFATGLTVCGVRCVCANPPELGPLGRRRLVSRRSFDNRRFDNCRFGNRRLNRGGFDARRWFDRRKRSFASVDDDDTNPKDDDEADEKKEKKGGVVHGLLSSCWLRVRR